MTKAEAEQALAAYLVPRDSIPQEIREGLEGDEIYGWSGEIEPVVTAPRGWPPAIFWVLDGLYSDELSAAIGRIWDTIDWIGEPSLLRVANVLTIVATPESPSFEVIEVPPVFSRLGIPVREARRRLADCRKVSRAVEDAVIAARLALQRPEFWDETARDYAMRPQEIRQDWRPRRRR